MAERHALHIQRMKEAMGRDAESTTKALHRSLEVATNRVKAVTDTINTAFDEALARLEVHPLPPLLHQPRQSYSIDCSC